MLFLFIVLCFDVYPSQSLCCSFNKPFLSCTLIVFCGCDALGERESMNPWIFFKRTCFSLSICLINTTI